MEKQTIKDVFDYQFKFAVNQELRHKGDNKENHHSDLGLLVLKRVMFENMDDDGNCTFERAYHCRMIKFSGSGEICQFNERELMSLDEYEQRNFEQNQWRQKRREEVEITQAEIYKAFGITKQSRVYQKDEKGQLNTAIEYRPSGWHSGKEGRKVMFTEIGGLQEGKAEFTASHPDQFEVIP